MDREAAKTYRRAGVDIGAADEAKAGMAGVMDSADRRVLNKPGAFASLFAADFAGMEDPVLVLKAEEPGTKQLLAFEHGRYESICRDLIHHLINDIAVMGARPQAVLDIVLCGRLEKDVVVRLVRHMAEACREQGCSLVGGETSEQPGALPAGRYMLSAAALGVADRRHIVDGSAIRHGDIIVAAASDGLHTNGFSLVRKLLADVPGLAERIVAGERFLDAVLRPHKCYYGALKGLFGNAALHGMAHITGGGIEDNLTRILPEGSGARIDLGLLRVPEPFRVIREAGSISDDEMLRVFNMGAGLLLTVAREGAAAAIGHLEDRGCEAYAVGEIVPGKRDVRFAGKLRL